MKIQPVIDRALQDPVFAAELASAAGKVSQQASPDAESVADGTPWRELMTYFADGPEELAKLAPTREGGGEEWAPTTTTTTTITTTTSLPCGITTTTTTTTTLTTATAVVRPE
ncbi:MAG: hypothetical protein GEU96_14680 [Propionibacteriales bacterium]|nr:hypothetical protein [Propionibacteriales bacterium]